MSKRILIDELEFDVPYGKLRAKTWHEDIEGCQLVLALHGWMDNAGTFDNLIPRLTNGSRGLYVVAVDMPGHGRSTPLPDGTNYTDMKLLVEVRRFVKLIGWNDKRFTIIGHSMGGLLAQWYASLYPDNVDGIVLLDMLKPPFFLEHDFVQLKSSLIEDDLETDLTSDNKMMTTTSNVTISTEAALTAIIEAHSAWGRLDRSHAMRLLARSSISVNSPPHSVIYYRDSRLRAMAYIVKNPDTARVIFSQMKSPILALLGKHGVYSLHRSDSSISNDRSGFCTPDEQAYQLGFESYIQQIRSQCVSLDIKWIEKGDHFMHLTRPEDLSDSINEFFTKKD
ncbi:Serine hydrolase-like protein, partial [Fragariocoptes setiger]